MDIDDVVIGQGAIYTLTAGEVTEQMNGKKLFIEEPSQRARKHGRERANAKESELPRRQDKNIFHKLQPTIAVGALIRGAREKKTE